MTIKKIFDEIDIDRSGKINLEEFQKAFAMTHGFNRSVQELFEKFDIDNSGLISFREFLSTYCSHATKAQL